MCSVRTFFAVSVIRILGISFSGLARAVGDDTNPVYVLIVDNRNTTLRPDFGADPIKTVPTPDIISCEETRTFWVSWDNRVIGESDHG